MIHTRFLPMLVASAAIVAGTSAHAGDAGVLTYQGRLMDGGVAFNGSATITFDLYDAAAGGTFFDSCAHVATVADGLFTVELDFNSLPFDGTEYWLEIDVDGTILTPRQKITPAPYASFALNAPFRNSGGKLTYTGGEVGVGNAIDDPLAPFHAKDMDLGLTGALVGTSSTIFLAEALDSYMRLYSSDAGTYGSAITLQEADGGVNSDWWRIRRQTSSTGSQLGISHSDGMVMTLDPDGQVGIGTTTPDARLEVEHDGAVIKATSTDSVSATATFEVDSVSRGYAARIDQSNVNATAPAMYISTNSDNNSRALQVSNFGSGSAAEFVAQDIFATGDGVRGIAHGDGCGVYGVNDTGEGVGVFASSATTNSVPLFVNKIGASGGDLAVLRWAGFNRARINDAGRGFFNGGTQSSGADVAEAFEVEGAVSDYEPGDVLVISTTTDRTVAKSAEPYSTLVAGVHATKPGVLLTDRSIDDSLDDTVPMGVVGVIPTKVIAENGPIRRGDLLVTSSLAGHAMKGTDRSLMIGAIIGKALADFDGPGAGVIEVMVNVKWDADLDRLTHKET